MRQHLVRAVGFACVMLALLPACAVAGQLRWSAPTKLANGVFGISCPSAQLCVAGTDTGVTASTNPGGGASAWAPSASPPSRRGFGAAVHGVACPSTSFCVAVGTGSILTSTNPAGGASTWRVTPVSVPSSDYLDGVACASRSLCVAFAASSRQPSTGASAPRNGLVFSSTDPAGGASAWKRAVLHDVPDYAYCLPRVCVLATEDGDILTARHPARGASAWTTAHEFGAKGDVAFIPVIACASTRYCLAPIGGIAERGELSTRNLFDTKPFSWPFRQSFGGVRIPAPQSGWCVSDGFCAFSAQTGSGESFHAEIVSSAGPGRRWAVENVAADIDAISCPSQNFCVAAGTRLLPPQNFLGGAILVGRG